MNELKLGEVNNCENCGNSYSTYNTETELTLKSPWKEMNCVIPVMNNDGNEIEKPKGVCQFCNPKSKLFFKKIHDET